MTKLKDFIRRGWRTMAFVAGVTGWVMLGEANHSTIGAVAMGLGVCALVTGKDMK